MLQLQVPTFGALQHLDCNLVVPVEVVCQGKRDPCSSQTVRLGSKVASFIKVSTWSQARLSPAKRQPDRM